MLRQCVYPHHVALHLSQHQLSDVHRQSLLSVYISTKSSMKLDEVLLRIAVLYSDLVIHTIMVGHRSTTDGRAKDVLSELSYGAKWMSTMPLRLERYTVVYLLADLQSLLKLQTSM